MRLRLRSDGTRRRDTLASTLADTGIRRGSFHGRFERVFAGSRVMRLCGRREGSDSWAATDGIAFRRAAGSRPGDADGRRHPRRGRPRSAWTMRLPPSMQRTPARLREDALRQGSANAAWAGPAHERSVRLRATIWKRERRTLSGPPNRMKCVFGGVFVVPKTVECPVHPTWREVPARRHGQREFRRFVIETHLIRPGERLERTLEPYLRGAVRPGDWLAVSEKAVAIAEGRAVLLSAVRPRPLARLLARHVRELGYGLGFRRPETMEMALREAGVARILLAAAVAAAGRFLGRSGDFYRVAGRRVTAIDGPAPITIPPYDRYIVLAPLQAEDFCRRLARRLQIEVAVVDVNDIGSEVLASTPGMDRSTVRALLT